MRLPNFHFLDEQGVANTKNRLATPKRWGYLGELRLRGLGHRSRRLGGGRHSEQRAEMQTRMSLPDDPDRFAILFDESARPVGSCSLHPTPKKDGSNIPPQTTA